MDGEFGEEGGSSERKKGVQRGRGKFGKEGRVPIGRESSERKRWTSVSTTFLQM